MHLHLEAPVLSLCPKCGQSVLPHTVCRNCGQYKGEAVVDVMKKLNRQERKKKEKELAQKEEAEKKGIKKEEGLSWEGLSKKQ